MKTAGFDIVILLNEKFLNQVSGALLYNGFMTFNGKSDFKDQLTNDQIQKIPTDLRHLLEVSYRFKLNYEPYIDFRSDNTVGISLDARVYFWFWEGLELKFDTKVALTCPISIDQAAHKFVIDFKNANVDNLTINYQYTLEQNVSLKLDSIINKAMKAYFQSSDSEKFSISLPSFEVLLPELKEHPDNKMPVQIMGMKSVSDQSLVIASNLFGYTGGDINKLTDFARNSSVGVAISELAMYKVYNHFWEYTSWSKRFHKNDSFNIDMVDDVLGVATDIISFIANAGIKIASLGFLEASIKYLGTLFTYNLDIDFKTKPLFDIMAGNRVRIFNLGVDAVIRLKAVTTIEGELKFDTSGPIPDECTPWEDDITIKKERKKITILDIGVAIRGLKVRSCTGEIILDPANNTLTVNVLELDVNIDEFMDQFCLYRKLPEKLKNKIEDACMKKLLDAIPPIILSPSLEADIPLIPWKLHVEGRKLTITDSEAIVGAHMYFDELQKNIYPVPKYVVNINNQEVHKAGCDSVMDTYETHQRGYYILSEAIKKNDGCKKCLPAFHTK